ncbi:Glutathione S-transferase kappa 1 [Podila humilis]|nr:Glutathione S-transferase kappa 1 [Podila humilis]
MAARHSITCYFDVVSPYSYFGVILLNRFARQHWKNVDVDFKPFFLHGIMQFQDLSNLKTLADIPYKFPSQFPLGTIGAMRLLLAIKAHASDKYVECIEKEAYWGNDQDISTIDVQVAVLSPILGGADKVQEMLKLSTTKDVKQTLVDNTNQALEKGAFGAPTFFVKKAGQDDEVMLFGSDRFEILASILDLPYPGLGNIGSKL